MDGPIPAIKPRRPIFGGHSACAGLEIGGANGVMRRKDWRFGGRGGRRSVGFMEFGWAEELDLGEKMVAGGRRKIGRAHV